MSEKIIYLNGAFMPESEAKVSVLDSRFNMVGLASSSQRWDTWNRLSAIDC